MKRGALSDCFVNDDIDGENIRQNETLVQTLTDSSNRHLSAISAPGPSTLASVESNTPGKPPSPNES